MSFYCLFVCFQFRAIPVAYLNYKAKIQIRATVAGLGNNHSNVGSKLCLRPTHSSQQRGVINPLIEATGPTHPTFSWILVRFFFFFFFVLLGPYPRMGVPRLGV